MLHLGPPLTVCTHTWGWGHTLPTRCPGTTIRGRSGGSLQPDADENEDSSIVDRHKLSFSI